MTMLLRAEQTCCSHAAWCSAQVLSYDSVANTHYFLCMALVVFFQFKACRIITALYSRPAEQRWVKSITMPEKKNVVCLRKRMLGEDK